jgi:hypothetical protein
MPELPGDRQHLTGGHRAIGQEDRDAVAGERGVGAKPASGSALVIIELMPPPLLDRDGPIAERLARPGLAGPRRGDKLV